MFMHRCPAGHHRLSTMLSRASESNMRPSPLTLVNFVNSMSSNVTEWRRESFPPKRLFSKSCRGNLKQDWARGVHPIGWNVRVSIMSAIKAIFLRSIGTMASSIRISLKLSLFRAVNKAKTFLLTFRLDLPGSRVSPIFLGRNTSIKFIWLNEAKRHLPIQF